MKTLTKKIITFAVLIFAGALSCAAQGAIPDLSSRRLLNDLQVTVARTQQFGDSVTMGLIIRYGAAFDPEDRGGLTNLVTRMLMKATADRTEQGIREELENLGASIDISSNWDGIRILLRVPSSGFDRALLLLQQIVVEARFEEADFDEEAGE